MNEYTTIIIIVSIIIFILLFVAAAKIDAADAVSLMESEAKPMAAEPEIEVIPIWDVPMPEEETEDIIDDEGEPDDIVNEEEEKTDEEIKDENISDNSCSNTVGISDK